MRKLSRQDLSTATRVRNAATGTVYERVPGTDRWTCPRWPGTAGTTGHARP